MGEKKGFMSYDIYWVEVTLYDIELNNTATFLNFFDDWWINELTMHLNLMPP